MRHDDDWNHYQYVYAEGREAHIRFDVGAALFTPATHNRCVRVVVRGDPEDLEDRLPALLAGVDCWFVGVSAHPGATAFVFQVEDEPAFTAREAALIEAIAATIELERSEGWGFFDERVCPNEVDWQRIADREQCESYLAQGIDLDQDRPVAHGFYGSENALARIRDRLLTEQLTEHPASGERLVMVREHSLRAVSDVSVPLARLARSVGAAYDGWRPAEMW